MRRQQPAHQRDDVVVAKLWLIGRVYAAAIERRRDTNSPYSDRFYTDHVVPAVRRSGLDGWLRAVSAEPASLQLVLATHHDLTELFKKITGLAKVSLASKYLHFHVPAAFFIFDSRAAKAIRTLTAPLSKVDRHSIRVPLFNRPYAEFVHRCLTLTADIERLIGRRPSPRELDKILLVRADQLTAGALVPQT